MIEIKATAYHDNDLSKVWLLVNNVYMDSLNWNPSNNYIFYYTPDFSVNPGPAELTVLAEAFDQPGNISFDHVTVNIEGIVPKTGNP